MTALDKRKECIQRRSLVSNSERLLKEKAITNCVLPFLKGKSHLIKWDIDIINVK